MPRVGDRILLSPEPDQLQWQTGKGRIGTLDGKPSNRVEDVVRHVHVLCSSIVFASALACAAASASAAGSSTDIGKKKAAVAPLGPAGTSLGALVSSISKTDDTTLSTTSGTFVDIPGASVNVVVPSRQKRGFHVTLSGTCAIDGAGAEEDVVVQVLVNNVVIEPGPTTLCEDFSTDLAIPEGGHAQQWVQGRVGTGVYTIKAQWLAESGATGFLRDMNFTVRVHK